MDEVRHQMNRLVVRGVLELDMAQEDHKYSESYIDGWLRNVDYASNLTDAFELIDLMEQEGILCSIQNGGEVDRWYVGLDWNGTMIEAFDDELSVAIVTAVLNVKGYSEEDWEIDE